MKQLLICDDEPERLRDWRERLGQLEAVTAEFELMSLQEGELKKEIGELERRRVAAREGHDLDPQETKIDQADLVLVDYDLALLDESVYQTGEGMAYLARCFSTCGFIVGLNQFGENPFDLTLRGHPESYADLNIGGEQVANPGLWTLDFSSFRPWSWPLLPRAVEAFTRRSETVAAELDTPIFEFLGLNQQTLALPRSLQHFIARREDPDSVTFRTFVRRSESALRARDGNASLDDPALARIAASRIAKWLERMILPGQDIFVDAPHLALRFPSLLASDAADPQSWQATVRSIAGTDTGLRDDQLERHRFRLDDWISRPSWWWQSVANDEAIAEVSDPWAATPPAVVFAEDTSRFVEPDRAEEFVAELASPFVRRYVEWQDDDPLRREVAYEPSVSFAL